MLSSLPAIGARFDIDKVNAGAYGIECWKVFWRALNPEDIAGSLLFEGDTAATLNGQENVYCIVVQHLDAAVAKQVRSALSQSEDFKKVCDLQMFVEDSRCRSEPLPDAGRIDATGNLIGDAWNSRPALGAIKKERESANEKSTSLDPVPERARPASDRTRTLPSLTKFEDVRALVQERFTPKDTDFSYTYWMTPEELCDLAEQYADLLEVQFSEYSCPRSEDLCCVRLFEKAPSDGRPIELAGLFAFPSESDARSFINEYKSAPRYARALPQLAGIKGKYQLNFGKGSENPRYITYEKDAEIPAASLWGKFWIRRQRFAEGLEHEEQAARKQAEDEKRRQAEEEKRRAEQKLQREADEARRRDAEKRKQELIRERTSRRECIACGRALGTLEKLFRRTSHSGCHSFHE
jgi:hypothetical protein